MAARDRQTSLLGFSPEALKARFVLNPEAILRDESRYQSSGAYLVSLMRKPYTACVDQIAFKLLVYLATVRKLEAIGHYYCSLRNSGPEEEVIADFKALMCRLVDDEIVYHLPNGMDYSHSIRPVYLQIPPSLKFSSVYEPLSFPTQVTLFPTGACNLRCRHCQAVHLLRDPDELTLEEMQTLLTRLDEVGTHHVKFTGGEVTVRPDIWDILRFAATKRFGIAFLTNATLLTPRNIDLLGEIAMYKKRGFIVSSSLDGACAETHDWMRGIKGAFNKTIKAFQLMKKARVDFVVQCTIHRRNLDELDAIADLVFEVGACTLYFVVACGLGRAVTNVETAFLMDEVKRIAEKVWAIRERLRNHIEFDARHTPFHADFRPEIPEENNLSAAVETIPLPPRCCPAGISSLTISSQGKVYPCVDAVGVSCLEMGDVRREDLVEIWHKECWNLFRGGFEWEDLKVCRTCQSFPVCGVKHCRAYPAAALGDVYGPKPECLRNFKRLGIDPQHVQFYQHKLVPYFQDADLKSPFTFSAGHGQVTSAALAG